jgi:hypothetical protein
MWKPLFFPNPNFFEKELMRKYMVNEHCEIKNEKGLILKPNLKTFQIGLSAFRKQRRFRTYRLCIMAFFPDNIPENYSIFDVDHIDGTKRNHISNLQWLSKSEHTIKTNKQTKRTRKRCSDKKSKKVRLIEAP